MQCFEWTVCPVIIQKESQINGRHVFVCSSTCSRDCPGEELCTLILCVGFPWRNCMASSHGWWRAFLAAWMASSWAGIFAVCREEQILMSIPWLWISWIPGKLIHFSTDSEMNWWTNDQCLTFFHCANLSSQKRGRRGGIYMGFSFWSLFAVARWWSWCTNSKQKSTDMISQSRICQWVTEQFLRREWSCSCSYWNFLCTFYLHFSIGQGVASVLQV